MILLGLKNNKTSGTFHGLEGVEGFSMEGTNVTILKEGAKDELVEFVKTSRQIAKGAKVKLDKLEDAIEEDFSITEKQYMKKSLSYIKKMAILKFDQLLIVEGMIV